MFILRTDLANSDDNEIVPQVHDMGIGYDWDAPEALTKISVNAPLAYEPNLRTFHLDPDTRFTDVVSQGYISTKGLLVSDRFLGLIDGLSVQPHEAYPADAVLDGEARRYAWIHITEELEARVDYPKSLFHVEPKGDAPGGDVTVESREELDDIALRLIDSLSGVLTPRRVTFLPGTAAYDFFCLQFMLRSFFATPQLAERLSGANVTGVDLAPTDTEFVFAS